MKRITLFSFIFLFTFSVVGQTVKIIRTENKPDKIISWIYLQGFQGNYQIFIHYTYNFQNWSDLYVKNINLQNDQQIGVVLLKECFTRNFMFWKIKFVKN